MHIIKSSPKLLKWLIIYGIIAVLFAIMAIILVPLDIYADVILQIGKVIVCAGIAQAIALAIYLGLSALKKHNVKKTNDKY